MWHFWVAPWAHHLCKRGRKQHLGYSHSGWALSPQQSWRHLQALLQPHSQLRPLPNSYLGVQLPLGPHLSYTPASLAFPPRSPAPGLMGGVGLAPPRGGSSPHTSTTCGAGPQGSPMEQTMKWRHTLPAQSTCPQLGLMAPHHPPLQDARGWWATQETRGAPSKGPPSLGLGVGGNTPNLRSEQSVIESTGSWVMPLAHWIRNGG